MAGKAAWAVASKDLLVEVRSKQLLNSVAPFVLALLVVFGLTFGTSRVELQASAPVVLWVAVLLSSLLTVRRSFDIETEDGALEGFRLSPADRTGIFLGKTAAVAIQLIALALLTLAGVVILFSAEVATLPLLVGSLALGCIGLSAIGVLFSALLARTRGTDSLLPLLVFPVVIPVVLAGVRTTQLAFRPGGPTAQWVGMMAAFAVIATAGSGIVFEYLVDD